MTREKTNMANPLDRGTYWVDTHHYTSDGYELLASQIVEKVTAAMAPEIHNDPAADPDCVLYYDFETTNSLGRVVNNENGAASAYSLYNNYSSSRATGKYLFCDLASGLSLANTNFTVEMFYKSAAAFDVGNIPDDDFFEFAKARFSTGRRNLPRALFREWMKRRK